KSLPSPNPLGAAHVGVRGNHLSRAFMDNIRTPANVKGVSPWSSGPLTLGGQGSWRLFNVP
ncbi:MAG: hypothetical protein ACP5HK_07010, partial [Acidilobus sp.]